MPGECSICLCQFKEPASIPCGHIFCKECIYECVNAQPAGSRAECPVCRKEFNIVLPDLQFLPPKYHEYVLPSLRRVYFDEQPSEEVENLKAQLSRTQSQLQQSQQQRLQLQQQVDLWKGATEQARQQEAEANEKLRRSQYLGIQWMNNHNQVANSYAQLEDQYRKLLSEHNLMKEKSRHLLQKLGLTRPPPSQPPAASPVETQPGAQPSNYQQNPQYFTSPVHGDGATSNTGSYLAFPGGSQHQIAPLQPSASSNTPVQLAIPSLHSTATKRNSQIAFEDVQQPYSPSTTFPSKRLCIPNSS